MGNIKQTEEIGVKLAEMVHVAMYWEEPANGDDIEEIVKSFEKELKELNGES